jgi:hypothetical protein
LKTTISVMGLNERLQPYLDVFEYEVPTDERFQQLFLQLQAACNAAIEEAKHFHQHLGQS